MPMGPITMMRNQLERKGGTKALYSPDEWAKSAEFWQKYAPLEDCSPKQKSPKLGLFVTI